MLIFRNTRQLNLSRKQLGKLFFTRRFNSTDAHELLNEERAIDKTDVLIVGGGPAGLASAIRLKQKNSNLRVVLLEKASEFGGHTVSGVIMEPRSLNELFPDSINKDGIALPEGLLEKVSGESLKFLLPNGWNLPLPEPPAMINTNKNFVGSLSKVVAHLAEEAENLGVELYSGIAVSEVIYNETKDKVIGVATKDLGINKEGLPGVNFERGMEFHSRQVILAEGCHGSLTKKIINKFNLRKGKNDQSYGLGIKEVWEVPKAQHKPGYISHTMGFPLNLTTYGGGFQYHFGENQVAVGLVLGLDYKNPYISPFKEFQKMKHHPFYANILKDGKCVSYAARALNEGGFQCIPKLSFPGGCLVGASAGLLNVPKIKGTHTAIKSGILAADSVVEEFEKKKLPTVEEIGEEEVLERDLEVLNLENYQKKFNESWIYKELYEVRNIRPSFNTKLGAIIGMCFSGLDSFILKGKIPFTFNFHKDGDAKITEDASKYKPIAYDKPDNKLSFDILTSVNRTGTYHSEHEQSHLKISNLTQYKNESYPKYQGIEEKFCPAGVYEYIADGENDVKLQVNSQNCIHCKTCDIKSPIQGINWEVPEGGDGPKYTNT
ncbi:hypothetical protein QEN19_003170 [Hanseniaspora menglaensis]